MKKDKAYCIGCRENFYNGNNDLNIKECWNYKRAKVIKAYCIGWWVPQDRAENFYKVTTLNCHREPGSRAFYTQLPEHLRGKSLSPLRQ